MKKEIKRAYKSRKFLRLETEQKLMNYFYDLFQAKTKIGGMTYQQKHFFLDEGWFKGSICCFPIEGTDTELKPEGEACFTPFHAQYWNIYNFPTSIRAINNRGVPFIPSDKLIVDKDACILYFRSSRLPIREYVNFYVKRMVDIEMLKDNNILTMKNPYMIAVSPEDRRRLDDIMNRIYNDEVIIFSDFEDLQAIKTLINNSPFILDKLEEYEMQLQNKILTFLGINCVENEKKEHLIVDEVNSNNQFIQINEEAITDRIQDFFDKLNEVFGFKFNIKVEKPLVFDENNEDDEDEEEDENVA